MNNLSPDETAALNERHRARMERKKAVIDAKIAAADKEIGILIVNTGNGKGKSSSGFGMVARLGKGTSVALTRERVEPNLWLPTSIRCTGSGRALLFRRLAIDQSIEWLNYRRAR